MTIRPQIGWLLESIPNRHGFRFHGVMKNGDIVPCIVERGPDGIHRAVNKETGESMYGQLRGWMHWLPPKVTK